jgi:transposase
MQQTKRKPHCQLVKNPKDKEIDTLKSKLNATEKALERLEERLSQAIKGYQNQINRLDTEILSLKLTIKKKDQDIEDLRKLNTYLTICLFGQTSEKHASTQLKNAPATKEGNGEKRKKGQQKGSKGHGRAKRDVPNQTKKAIELTNTGCETCGKEFKVLDMTKDSRVLEYLQVVQEIIYQRQMATRQCQCPGPNLMTADLPVKLMKYSDIGNSLWVHLLIMKYLFAMPTNRILKSLSLQGVRLPAGTVTGGFRILDTHFTELYEEIKRHCQGADLWNADETSWRILDADKMKHWLWVVAAPFAVVYLLDPSRSSRIPNEFLSGSKGVLVTDRYSAYKALHALIRKAWCWVHVRRDFLAIYKGIKKHRKWAGKWLRRIAALFAWNHKRFSLTETGDTDEEKWREADNKLRELIARFDEEVRKELSQNQLDKHQSKVMRSLRRHWTGLTLFVDEPRIPMHNNRAERLLRNSVLIRNGSYGSGTAWSGQLAAKVLTIFQTWQLNGLNPETLLRDFIDAKSITGAAFSIDNYLPWKMSEERKTKFALPASVKRPA